MGKDIDVPTNYTVDIGMNDVNMDVNHTMDINSDSELNLKISDSSMELDMGLDDVKIDMGLDKMAMDLKSDSKLDMGLDKVNICLNMGIKELPKMKFHMPMNYDFGFDFFGMKILNFSVKGKSMLVSEDNPTQMFYHPKKKAVAQYKPRDETINEIRLSVDKPNG